MTKATACSNMVILCLIFCSVQFSWSFMSYSLRPHGLQHPRLPVHYQLPEFTQTHVHYSQWCNPTISSSVIPFSSCPQSFPASGSFPMSQLFTSGGQSIFKEFQLQHQFFQWTYRTDLLSDGLVGSPCSPRDSQESSPTPHFKNINSLVLSFLYSPTHIYIWLLEKP